MAEPYKVDTSKRAVDNMLLHSAYEYFREPTASIIDPHARQCFLRFVDTYINAPHRYALLAGPTIGAVDPFIRIWHEGSNRLPDAGRPLEGRALEDLWTRFQESLKWNRSEWVTWLQSQWSGNTPGDFKNLVVHWREEFRTFTPLILSHTNETLIDPDLELFKEALEQIIAPAQMDPEYRDEMRRARMGPVDFGVLYCFDMFQRGFSYALRTPGITAAFHSLRDGVSVTKQDDVSSTMDGPNEIRWGRILDACLIERLIPREPSAFIETLSGFRQTVRAGGQFEDLMRNLTPDMTPSEHHGVLRDAVLNVFLEQGIAPALRMDNTRGRILSIVEAIIASGTKGVATLLFEIVKISANSTTARFVDIEVRKRLGKDKVWKVYRVPGLD